MESNISELKNDYLYFCYNCAEIFIHQKPTLEILRCRHCKNEFIEKIDQEFQKFNPFNMARYRKQQTDQYRIEHTGSHNIKKTMNYCITSPFVREVLMEMFPDAFRRATIERIQVVRNILESLNQMTQEETNTGPTDPKYIQKLQRFTATKEHFEIHCSICTDNFQNSEILMEIGCSHTFHEDCIMPWLQTSNSCPTCRYSLPIK